SLNLLVNRIGLFELGGQSGHLSFVRVGALFGGLGPFVGGSDGYLVGVGVKSFLKRGVFRFGSFGAFVGGRDCLLCGRECLFCFLQLLFECFHCLALLAMGLGKL